MGAGHFRPMASSPSPTRSSSSSAANLQERLNGVYRRAILAPGEDLALIEHIRAGGPQSEPALGRLLEGIQPYIVMVARKYDRKGVELEDLIQEGNLGALRALEDFNVERGVKFLTYADDWIRKYMREAVVRHGSVSRYGSRLPSQQYHALQRVERSYEPLAEQLGRNPSAEELAEYCAISPSQAHWALEVRSRRLVALNADSGTEDTSSLADALADPQGIEPEQLVLAAAEREALWQAFARLDVTEQRILRLRLGLDDGASQASWDVVAEELELGRGQVKRIQERAMAKLGVWVQRAGLDELLADRD